VRGYTAQAGQGGCARLWNPAMPETSRLCFKLRPDEHIRLREAAALARVGPSTYAAEAVRQILGTERRRPLPRRLDSVAEAVRAATGQLGHLGNNVNQLARAGNRGELVDAEALTAIRDGLAAIDARLAAALSVA